MDLTPEQIEHWREFWIKVHGPWTAGAIQDMNALCDMALQTAARRVESNGLTPRTEAEKPFRWADLTPDQQWNQNGYYVDADFARTLERELNAAHARITQLEQALREATAVIEEDYGHGVDNGYWPTVEPLLKRLRDLDHLAAAQNDERPAEESVPRGAHNLSPEEYDALVRDAMQWRHSKLSA